MLPQSANEHYRRQARISDEVAALLAQLWRRVDFDNLDESYPLDALLVAISMGQVQAASLADPYVAQVLAELGIESPVTGTVQPRGFIGTSDGRPMDGLLAQPVIDVKQATAKGFVKREAMQSGLASLLRIGTTQVQDAGRTAVGAAIAARPAVGGYTRVLSLPACSRCVVLAGKWYEWNSGFQRHPGCDCRHVPADRSMAKDLTTDPRQAIQSGKVTGLSKAELAAIEEGSDIGQVINARQGMYTAGGRKFTRAGTSTRGSFGRQARAEGAGSQLVLEEGRRQRTRRVTTLRLTPEQIYIEAAGNRDEAVRLLKRFGYLG